jgi:glycerol-3-phosphate dehydrogenase subunit B
MSAERVIVIGGGAAGAAAALAAAAACEVRVVRQALGATALSSGAVDLAGQTCELAGDPWRYRPSLRAIYAEHHRAEREHPLAVAGVTAERASRILQELCQAVPLLCLNDNAKPLERPSLVLPTDHGTFKSTTACQRPARGGELLGLEGARLGVVGLVGYPGYDSQLLAEGYAHHARRGGIELEAIPLAVELLRLQGEELMHPSALAARLEERSTLERLAERLAWIARLEGLTHLVLPPVLGLTGWQRVLEHLAEQTGAVVCEMLASPPSVPGLRLQRTLDTTLEAAGVTVLQGAVRGFRAAGGRLSALLLEDGQELEGDAFVLATGKFIGGGLAQRRSSPPAGTRQDEAAGAGQLVEPIFGLPVWIGTEGPNPVHLAPHVDRQVAGPHPLLAAGIRVNPSLQPLGADGHPTFANLHAAGSVIGGYDYITGRSGLGTALITGHLAGLAAAGAQPSGRSASGGQASGGQT